MNEGGEIREVWVGEVAVRWRRWPSTGSEADSNLMWEVWGPNEQSVVRLGRRVVQELVGSTAGKPRDRGTEWMMLGVYHDRIERVEDALHWLERMREVLLDERR